MKNLKVFIPILLIFVHINCLTFAGGLIDTSASGNFNSYVYEDKRPYNDYTISTKIGSGLDGLIAIGIIGYGISLGTAAAYVAGGFGGLIYFKLAWYYYVYFTRDR